MNKVIRWTGVESIYGYCVDHRLCAVNDRAFALSCILHVANELVQQHYAAQPLQLTRDAVSSLGLWIISKILRFSLLARSQLYIFKKNMDTFIYTSTNYTSNSVERWSSNRKDGAGNVENSIADPINGPSPIFQLGPPPFLHRGCLRGFRHRQHRQEEQYRIHQQQHLFSISTIYYRSNIFYDRNLTIELALLNLLHFWKGKNATTP